MRIICALLRARNRTPGNSGSVVSDPMAGMLPHAGPAAVGAGRRRQRLVSFTGTRAISRSPLSHAKRVSHEMMADRTAPLRRPHGSGRSSIAERHEVLVVTERRDHEGAASKIPRASGVTTVNAATAKAREERGIFECFAVVVGLTIWMAQRHFSALTVDLLAWIPFAMFLRCLYLQHKSRKARPLE